MIGSLTENDGINYLNKKQANVHSIQKKFKKVNLKKPLNPRVTTKKKPLHGRTTPRRTSLRKPLTTKTTRRGFPNNKPLTKKPVLPTTRLKERPKLTTTTRKTQTSKATKPSTIKPIIDKLKTKLPTITTSVTTTPKPDNLSKYIDKTINDINALRVEYKRKRLIVDDQLARESQNYSNYYVKSNGMLEPYENEGMLEYIYFNNEISNFDAVNYWAINDDNEEIDDSWGKFLHPEFGQLIAKNATHIGCGINKTLHFTALFCKIHPAWNADDDDY